MKTLIVLCMALLVSVTAQAQEIVVVAGPSSRISSLSTDDLEKLYLGHASVNSEGQEITLYDLENSAVRQKFYQAAFSLSLIQLRAYWARLVFTGRGRPPRQLSTEALIARLQSDEHAVGYLPIDKAEGLTILQQF